MMTIEKQLTDLMTQVKNPAAIGYCYSRIQRGLSLHGYHTVKEKDVDTYSKELLNSKLVTLADQMHEYIAINHFYYDAVEALLNENDIAHDTNQYSGYGLTLITRWLCQQDKSLSETLTQIISHLDSMPDDNLKAKQ